MKDKPTLMQMQVSLPIKIVASICIMALLIAFVYGFNAPNPNMILVIGLVLCSAVFGFGGGIVAAAIMTVYTLFFFSTDHSFTRFTDQNLQKVAVSLIGVVADTLLICLLKRTEVRAFCEVDKLTEQLHQENRLLQHMSLTDALTGIRNRMALRQAREGYSGREISVMMLDINDFKIINDTRGHEEGDRILRQTGALLTDTFGEDACYRYGGDEFLVIAPDITEAAFREKIDAIMRARPVVEGDRRIDYSVGHIHARLDDPEKLRDLIACADERMYEQKREKEAPPAPSVPAQAPQSKATEYTVEEMKTFLDEMKVKYDLARVVDPIECRILDFMDDGRISLNESCYGIWNAEQRCINCSSALACRTGCHQEKAEHFQDQLYYIQSNPVSLRLRDGSVYDAVLELVNVEKEGGGAANDREAENIGTRAAHYMAHHDKLTNLYNADAFYELSREMIKNAPEVSWVMITSNIMNFRLANTLFGVTRCNEMLVRAAAMLKEITEATRGLGGRIGGDQYALLIPAAQYREASLVRVAQELSEGFNSGLYAFCIHFGVYRIEDASIPVSVMCGRANSALRTIREDVSRTVAYFDDTIQQKLLLEQKVISSFEDALRQGQFQMYLQPLVRADGTPFGAEALVRWVLPNGDIVMPGAFIETLEHAGMIQRLDMYIWELAVRQLSAWKGTPNGHLSISVNMSAKDFYSIDVYEVLTGLVERYGVDSRLLRLEITETALLVELEKSNSVVNRLREKGFLVEIDDFGKGYSSLGLLKQIQADVLKIDMSFLREINERQRSRAILQSVIDLAHTLGMDVITEGVENVQQLNVLTEMGCGLFQGYYFSRPIPANAFDGKYPRR